MSWLDRFIGGVITVQVGGASLPIAPTLNFVNGTGSYNSALQRNDVTIGAAGAIGGGAPTNTQSGAVTLPNTTACIALDLSAVNATVNLDQIPYSTGLAFQFDTIGSHNIVASSTRGIILAGNTTAQSTVTINPLGQSVVIKANAWGSWSQI